MLNNIHTYTHECVRQIQKERKAFNVTEKKPCIIEISEKGFSLHDNTDSMEVRGCGMECLMCCVIVLVATGAINVFVVQSNILC